MNEFRQIWINARFEMTTLLRGWFFRIFAVSMLALFIIINIIFFSKAIPLPNIFNGFSGSVPYANMFLLNLAQISMIIFLATDFFKRDRKFNTIEVFYIRSMTNTAYICGKALGIVIIFIGLDITILAIASVIHLLFSDISFSWQPYTLYPLIIGLPSILFISGLSFILMRLIKNQAVVILLLLGFYAANIFYLKDLWYFVFDFAGFRLPLIYSDIVGIADMDRIFIQRIAYVSLGMSFIILTIQLFPRLEQSRLIQHVQIVAVLLLSVFSAALFYQYTDSQNSAHRRRAEMNQINDHYLRIPTMEVRSCAIDLAHNDEIVRVEARMQIQNNHSASLDSFYYSLNPGFMVSEVTLSGRPVKYRQNLHLLVIYTDYAIKPDFSGSLKLTYTGRIDESVCYLDIQNEALEEAYSIWLYRSACKYAFMEAEYVLLPPECLWYPRPGLPFGIGFPERMDRQFCEYELTVKTDANLSVISQGKKQDLEDGSVRFIPEYPLQDISLVIGPYEMKRIQVDSVEYSLFHFSGHDYYAEYLNTISDTLHSLIRDLKQTYEIGLNLEYPFNRLSLIEVPLQYYTYSRIWTETEQTVQPGQFWIQENALTVASADFKQLKRSMERRLERSNQTLMEDELQISVFKSFVQNTFLGKSSRQSRFGGPSPEKTFNYDIFPNYYSFVTFLKSSEWLVLNTAIEAYLKDRASAGDREGPSRFVEGLTKDEKISQALLQKSLAQHFNDPDSARLLTNILRKKGSYLLKSMENDLGIKEFEKILRQLIIANRFSHFTLKNITDLLGLNAGMRLEEQLDSWFNATGLPAFLVKDIQLYKVLDGERIRNQVLLKASNAGEMDGLFELSIRYGRRGRGFSDEQAQEIPRVYKLEKGESKEIGIVLDREPRGIIIDFLISKNLPLVLNKQFDKAEERKNRAPFDGTRKLSSEDFSAEGDGIIVDNVDQGFKVFNPPHTSLIKRWIHSELQNSEEEEYRRFQWWRPPERWSLVKNASLYGEFVHSAYYIGPGGGDKQVTWAAQIEQGGLYDVYMYMMSKEGFWRGRGRRRGVTFGDFNYRIYHDAGIDEITLDANQTPEGWNFLGTWYFSAGKAQVMLTDKSNGRIIVADAIKWVKN